MKMQKVFKKPEARLGWLISAIPLKNLCEPPWDAQKGSSRVTAGPLATVHILVHYNLQVVLGEWDTSSDPDCDDGDRTKCLPSRQVFTLEVRVVFPCRLSI